MVVQKKKSMSKTSSKLIVFAVQMRPAKIMHVEHVPLYVHIGQQECIPVGCVPFAAMAVYWGSLLPGGSAHGGGVSAHRGSAPGGDLLLGGVCSGGVSAPRGVSVPGGVCSWGERAWI